MGNGARFVITLVISFGRCDNREKRSVRQKPPRRIWKWQGRAIIDAYKEQGGCRPYIFCFTIAQAAEHI